MFSELLETSTLGQGWNFFYHSPTRIVKCVSEYIFLISKNKQTNKQTNKQNKNTKEVNETKEEKRISPENRFKKINLRPPEWRYF